MVLAVICSVVISREAKLFDDYQGRIDYTAQLVCSWRFSLLPQGLSLVMMALIAGTRSLGDPP